MRNASDQRSRGPRNDKRTWVVEPLRDRNGDPEMMGVMRWTWSRNGDPEMMDVNCLESFTRKLESPNSRTQSYRDITPNACDMWVKKDTYAWSPHMSNHYFFQCLGTFVHATCHALLPVYSMFCFTSFVLYLCLLILLYLFCLSVFKNSKNHKNLKNLQKVWSLVLCISHGSLA